MSNPVILYDNALRYGDGNQPVPSFQALFNGDETIDYGTGPITSTRSSVAYYFDATTGLLTSAAIDELRFERDLIDGVVRALIEGASTNQFIYSEQLDNAAWLLSGTLAVTPNTAVAPDGTTTADTLTWSAAGGQRLQAGIAVTAGLKYTVSCWVKAVAADKDFRLKLYDTVADLFSPDITATSEWARVEYTFTATGTGSGNAAIAHDVAVTAGSIYVWGMQFEAQPKATSYIPTTTVAVTRSADVVSVPNSVIPALSNGVTIGFDASIINDGIARSAINAAGTGATYIRRATSGVLEGQLGGVSFTTTTTPDENIDSLYIRTDGTNHDILVNGTSVHSFTGTLTQPTAALYIGSNAGSSEHINSLIGGLRIWSRYLTNAEINADSSGYAISTGLEQSGTFLTEAWTWDALRNAIVTADSAGAAVLNLFIRGATPTHFVLGAHRHDSAGFRVNEGTLYIDVHTASGWTNIGSANLATNASNLPELIALSAYTPVYVAGHYQFRARFAGLSVSADFALPELFLGEALVMPYVEYGFDPSVEEWTGPTTTAETGRIYESALSRRYTANPSFTYIDGSTATAIDTFRETHLEERTPFWWFWEPTGNPTVGYMMKHAAKSAPMPIVNAIYRKISLQMVEAV